MTTPHYTEHPAVKRSGFRNVEELIIHRMHARAYTETAHLVAGKVVLDLGCNDGYGTAILASTAARVVGADVRLPLLRLARSNCLSACTGLIQCNALTLPFSEGAFDAVVSLQVIEHVHDIQAYLAEVVRVLRPSGWAVFTTPNAALRLLPGQPPWNPFHVREYTADELEDLLRQSFDDVQLRGLFGRGWVHETEVRRCARSRDRAARGRSLHERLVSSLYERLRSLPHARRLLPAARRLRRMARTLLGGARPRALPDVTEADFEYRSSGLTSALDLMAICRHPRRGPSR